MNLRPVSLLLSSVLCLLTAGAAYADIDFTVNTQTSALIANAAGPFSLDFQFIDGSGLGDANNAVTLSEFTFGGGSWGGPASSTLSDTVFFSELLRQFTPGIALSFRVHMTTHIDAGPTPDEFSFAILDSAGHEIPTFGSSDKLLTVTLDRDNPLIYTYFTDPNRTSISLPTEVVINPTAPTVPDSRLSSAFIGCVWMLILLRCRNRRDLTLPSLERVPAR